jgi:hypothetical protein
MKNLDQIFSSFLLDNASTVRDTGVEKLVTLAQEFKADWIITAFLPKIKEVYDTPKQGYLFRMTALNCFASIIPFVSKEQTLTYICPYIVKGLKDTVPNVKFCALKLIRRISKQMDAQALVKTFKQYYIYLGL